MESFPEPIYVEMKERRNTLVAPQVLNRALVSGVIHVERGVSGCHIDDQAFPKRCGQLSGKDIVDMDTYVECTIAAVKAHRNSDFVIPAHTDMRNGTIFSGENADEVAFHEGIKSPD
ncbi:hypothetical protein SCP_0100430 [Sparassis crispa]|uniref:methylisocitrate lyase n=1 Tax=Sparassis crispa TaxID=139825 RepID=A0A401G4S6_9APHY|nr:hypothetical protein SCP_0100430 [Sparassis crispa]GBE77171.1 hypothetical protein SCP_0100430 [Sparassis crispa]